jgi:hypothetical protein
MHETSRLGFVSFVAFVIFMVPGCSSSNGPAVRQVMQTPIAPASDAIFNAIVYTNGQLVSAPQTDEQWNRLRAQAESLRGAAATTKALAPDEDAGEWLRQSDALDSASAAALRAIEAKSVDGLLDAGGNIYATCAACHSIYIKE